MGKGKDKFRVARLSANSAAIVGHGEDNLEVLVVSEGVDLDVVAKINWGGLLGMAKDIAMKGAKMLAGKCNTKVTQTITYDKNTGLATGSTVTVTVTCT
jgi:hypothetical protein